MTTTSAATADFDARWRASWPRVKTARRAIMQVALPVLAAFLALLWLEGAGGNRMIADQLFAWEGSQWLLKDHFVTSDLIRGGKYFSMALWFFTIAFWWQARAQPALVAWRTPLLKLWLATLLATIMVSALQLTTSLDCPWDMQPWGGRNPYFGLFDARPAGLKSSGCFPAGHASAGYCWLALYFFLSATLPRWRMAGLAGGLFLGMIFGISQQLRGAHFVSHDVVTLLVCWLTALAVHVVPWPQTRRSQ
jgi:membrane-associated PAP2 superfamily phosphatase